MTKSLGILAPALIRSEIEEKKRSVSVEITWARTFNTLVQLDADAYFDLEFDNSRQRIDALLALKRPVFISSAETPANEINPSFFRVNSWPGMLSRSLLEVAAGANASHTALYEVMNALNWQFILVPDIAGFISCRILVAIINEAYFTLQAGVSTKPEIDTAMKLGTNYPLGPFEWAEKIGVAQVARLLTRLSIEHSRYMPADQLNQYLDTGNQSPQ